MEEEVTDDEYRAALEALQSTISGKTRAAPKGPHDLTWEQQFDRLHVYLDRLGMTESVNAMSYIHVAGTKGKGSTCAFVDTVLRRSGTRTGLYTSPHLVDIRERYRVDGAPVSKTTFTRNFWWLHHKLKETCEADLGMPAYFRFLTLLGFRIFTSMNVDAVVLEVGLGGRLDATNVIQAPAVCGVTSLGLDHVEVLGDTVGKIAREKAGIFKPNCPAITSPQVPEAMESLELRASEVSGCELTVARPLRDWRTNGRGPASAGFGGEAPGAQRGTRDRADARVVRSCIAGFVPVGGVGSERFGDRNVAGEMGGGSRGDGVVRQGAGGSRRYRGPVVVPGRRAHRGEHATRRGVVLRPRRIEPKPKPKPKPKPNNRAGEAASLQLHGGEGPGDAAHAFGADGGGDERAHHRPRALHPVGELEQRVGAVRGGSGRDVAGEGGEDVGRVGEATRRVRAGK